MFRELARRASVNMGQYTEATETYLKWALKAQSQSRATMETLALSSLHLDSLRFFTGSSVALGGKHAFQGCRDLGISGYSAVNGVRFRAAWFSKVTLEIQ